MKPSLVLRPTFAMIFSVLAAAWACGPTTNDPTNTGGAAGSGAPIGGGPTGGTVSTGGTVATGGTVSTGGTVATGGAVSTGGTVATGGAAGSGGTDVVGGAAGTGGTDGVGGAAGSGGTSGAAGGGAGGTGGQSGGAGGAGAGGTGGMTMNAMGPCDIYAAASPATPCVAAYSTARSLRAAYTGPLYQLRKGGPDPNTGSGGMTQDIGQVGGWVDVAAHEAFCGTSGTCTFSILYDQSGRMNNLTVAKGGCYEGTAAEDDYESDAKRRKTTAAGGRSFYALYMDKHEGYRNTGTKYPTVGPAGAGMPTGSQEQGVYMVAEGSGKRQGAGCCCCWNFGNGSRNNCYGPTGQMNALFLGTGYWGKGAGNGPWFMGDFEAGVWAGGSGPSNAVNSMLPSMTMNYAFGILKTRAGNYAIRTADATTGNINTAYDGNAPANWTMEGAIILGIGGDNSNSSDGTFLEGAITAGRPSDATDALVHTNVKAVGYGMP